MPPPYSPPPGYPTQPGYPPPQRSGMGCFAKGCLTLVVIVMLLVVLGGFAGWYVFRNFTEIASQVPVPIRTYPSTDAEYQRLRDRYGEFVLSLNEGHAATLKLSADDLNTLVARDPGFKDVRGKVFFSLKDGEIIAEGSFPMEDSNRPASMRQTYYLNGRGFLRASYASGEFALHLRRLESMSGHPLSDPLIQFFNSLDLGKIFTEKVSDERRKGVAWAEALKRLQKIVVEGDQVVLTAAEGTPASNPLPALGSPPAGEETPASSPEPVADPLGSH